MSKPKRKTTKEALKVFSIFFFLVTKVFSFIEVWGLYYGLQLTSSDSILNLEVKYNYFLTDAEV